ncbi:uncharacterized protein BXZ73DRAFT_75775 [Epithele typhae]|uniref:uncharacterized protein n=1 Tax=Epithele typhae TaxID=378194 RepID=UPI002008CF0A|nr:uncharacterized protein BXZ73DRAFT_75775 [Epithele typhae]KAH9940178.1 hypothetical protein BXZ73DRAFT_75775 [Epithele typhae]
MYNPGAVLAACGDGITTLRSVHTQLTIRRLWRIDDIVHTRVRTLGVEEHHLTIESACRPSPSACYSLPFQPFTARLYASPTLTSAIDSVKLEGDAPQERAPPTKKPHRTKLAASAVDPPSLKKPRGKPPKARSEAPAARPPSPPLLKFRPLSFPAYPDDGPLARAASFDIPKHLPLVRAGSISGVSALWGLTWDPAECANMLLSALPWLAGAAYAPVPIHFSERDVLFGEHSLYGT